MTNIIPINSEPDHITIKLISNDCYGNLLDRKFYERLIQYHKDKLDSCKKNKIYYDSAESPQWSRETAQREANNKLLMFHESAIKFLEQAI